MHDCGACVPVCPVTAIFALEVFRKNGTVSRPSTRLVRKQESSSSSNKHKSLCGFGRHAPAWPPSSANVFAFSHHLPFQACRLEVLREARKFISGLSFLQPACFSTASAQTPLDIIRPAPRFLTLEGPLVRLAPAGDAVLHLVLHVSKSEDGTLKATLDSLDQGVYGIEVKLAYSEEFTLQFMWLLSAFPMKKDYADHSSIDGG